MSEWLLFSYETTNWEQIPSGMRIPGEVLSFVAPPWTYSRNRTVESWKARGVEDKRHPKAYLHLTLNAL